MSYETMRAHELATAMKSEDVHILDMRDVNSFKKGHIDGAEHVNDSLIKQFMRNKAKNSPLIIYCYHGNSSRDLASFFSQLGFSNVFNLEGGWQAWQNFIEMNKFTPSEELRNWLLSNDFSTTDLNSRIHNNMSPLLLSSLQGNMIFIKELLLNNADINDVNSDNNNALWFACVNGDIDTIQLLISNNINIDHINDAGATCLIYASSAGKDDVVRVLVEANANLSITTFDGFNALDSAATLATLKFLKPKYIQH